MLCFIIIDKLKRCHFASFFWSAIVCISIEKQSILFLKTDALLNVIVNSKLLLSLKGTLLLLLAFTISYCWSNSQDFDKKEFKPHFVSKMCFLCTHNCLYLIQVPLWARNDMPPFSKTNPAHGDKNSNMSGLYNWFRLSLEFIQTGFKPFLSNISYWWDVQFKMLLIIWWA